MKASLSKVGMVRIIIATVLSLCLLGVVMFGMRAYQVIFQQSSDEDYD